MVILVEGPDGSGKTTLAKKLAKALGYEYFHFGAPTNPIDQKSQPLLCKTFMQTHNNAVIDRMWPSGQVYAPIMRGETEIEKHEALAIEFENRRKLVMIYCTDVPDVLWERAKRRGEEYVPDKETFMKICRKYDEVMLEQQHPVPVHVWVMPKNEEV